MRFLAFVCAGSLAAQCVIQTARPEEVGLRPAEVEAFLTAARAANSDGVAIFKNGRYAGGFGESQRRDLRSITKAIVGMAAGRMFTEGKWSNLDAPLRDYVRDLAGDPKGAVTLRQLLSHTSGIRDARNEKGVLPEWNTARDWLAAAKAQPMEATPGVEYKYNNQGPVWIGAAIEETTGERLDKFLARTLFAPLCISRYDWVKDKTGRPAAYRGLSLSAYDLAKLGQLIVNRGEWFGQRVLSEDWIRQSALQPSQQINPRIGLLWFLRMQPEFPVSAITHHNGDGFQWIAIFPNHQLVVTRVARADDRSEFPFLELAVKHLLHAK
jgi:CubicO group peptidase (beta-lactamase class C family)